MQLRYGGFSSVLIVNKKSLFERLSGVLCVLLLGWQINESSAAQNNVIFVEVKDDFGRDVVFSVRKHVATQGPVVVVTPDVVQQLIKQKKMVELSDCHTTVYDLKFDNLFYIDELYEIRDCNRPLLQGNTLHHRVQVGKRLLAEAIGEIKWIDGQQSMERFGISDPQQQKLFQGFVIATSKGNQLAAGLIADRITEILIDNQRALDASKYAAYNFAIIGSELGVKNYVNIKQISSSLDGTTKYALSPTDALMGKFNQSINNSDLNLLPTMKVFVNNKEEGEKKRIQIEASEYTGLPLEQFSIPQN